MKLAVRTAQQRRAELLAMLLELGRSPITDDEADINDVLAALVRDIAEARLRAETAADDDVIAALQTQLDVARDQVESLRDPEWIYPPTLDEVDESSIESLLTERTQLQGELGKPVRLGTIESQRQRIQDLQHDHDLAGRGETVNLERSDVVGETHTVSAGVDGDAFSYARQVIFSAGEHPGVRIGRRHRTSAYSLPLVLDDPFVAYNDATLFAVLDWLCGAPIDRQLILLTGDQRVQQWADSRGLLRLVEVPTDRSAQREVRVFSAQTTSGA